MRLLAGSLALGALLSAGAVRASCPACTGGAEEKQRRIWPIVGAFLLVPPAVAATLVLLIRRETKTSPPGPGI